MVSLVLFTAIGATTAEKSDGPHVQEPMWLSFSSSVLSPSPVTAPLMFRPFYSILFLSRLKSFLFCKSSLPQPFLCLIQVSLYGFPSLFTLLVSISVFILFSFSVFTLF